MIQLLKRLLQRKQKSMSSPLEPSSKQTEKDTATSPIEKRPCQDFLGDMTQACLTGQLEELKRLVHSGGDPTSLDSQGRCLLHAAAEGPSVEVVDFLISKGAPLEAKSGSGLTPLHFAARKGHSGICRALLNAGADINAEELQYLTPLCYAVIYGHEGVVREFNAFVIKREGSRPMVTFGEDEIVAVFSFSMKHEHRLRSIFRSMEPKLRTQVEVRYSESALFPCWLVCSRSVHEDVAAACTNGGSGEFDDIEWPTYHQGVEKQSMLCILPV